MFTFCEKEQFSQSFFEVSFWFEFYPFLTRSNLSTAAATTQKKTDRLLDLMMVHLLHRWINSSNSIWTDSAWSLGCCTHVSSHNLEHDILNLWVIKEVSGYCLFLGSRWMSSHLAFDEWGGLQKNVLDIFDTNILCTSYSATRKMN